MFAQKKAYFFTHDANDQPASWIKHCHCSSYNWRFVSEVRTRPIHVLNIVLCLIVVQTFVAKVSIP